MLSHFDRYFELLPARDGALRDEVFRLRYAVYCVELGYERCDAFPDGMERDAFDQGRSAYALLRYRPGNVFAACVRLVHDPGVDDDFRFPFEVACSGQGTSVPSLTAPERRRSGEISRLAIHRDFRRRAGEWNNPEGIGEPSAAPVPAPSGLAERRQPLLPISLFLAANALALNDGLEQVYVMMEPRLARLLARSGMRFTQIGDVIDHHGRRAPFRIGLAQLQDELSPAARELTAAMRASLA